MLVYGGEGFDVDAAVIARTIAARAAGPQSRDSRLAILTGAGQLEQALLDGGHRDVADLAGELTVLAAQALVCFPLDRERRGHEPLTRLALVIANALAARSRLVTVRPPEGFAFYGLDPAGYAAAARAWLARNGNERVRVVGLLSIGTALSATVAAVSRSAGRDVLREIRRPGGPPFERRVEPFGAARPDEACVLVDEGPGLSGSSLAGAADAAIASGFPRAMISFMAGHGHGPGPEARPGAREWWSSAPVYVAADHELGPRLGAFAETCLGESLARPLVDIGAGRWVSCFRREAPTAFGPRLERPKWLATGRSGRSVVLKFAGIDVVKEGDHIVTRCDAARSRVDRLVERGLSVAHCGQMDGWLCLPRVKGVPLDIADADDVVTPVARLIRAAQREPLSADEKERAWVRISQLIQANAPDLGLGTRDGWMSSELEATYRAADLPSYGDGRLGPAEWTRLVSGAVIKLDCEGHFDDHTAVGEQSVLWDVAGFLAEWRLEDDSRDDFLLMCGITPTPAHCRLLWLHEAAYAAFRAGVADLEGVSTARAFYAQRMERALNRLSA